MAKTGRSNWLGVVGGIVGFLASVATIVGLLLSFGITPNPFTAPPSPTATPKPLTAADILDHAQSATFHDMSGTIATTFSAPCGLCFPSSGDIVFTSNPVRSSSSITYLGAKVFTIIDSNTQYTRKLPPNDAKWVKGPTDSAQDNLLVRYYANLAGASLIGAEQISGHPSYHLRLVRPNPNDATSSTTYDLWVRADTFYLIQYVEVRASPTLATTITLQVTVWNAGAIISLPSPDQIVATTPAPTPTP
jgi:hypothetical protein